MPHVREMSRPVRNMHAVGCGGAAVALLCSVTGLSVSVTNCGAVDIGMIVVGALAVLFALFALIVHAVTRSVCTPQSAAMAGGLSLGALVCSIAATVYYNVYFTNYYYDDDYVYSDDDWEQNSVCRVSVIFFGVATTCNIIAAVGGLVLRRRLALGATYAPLVYGQGGTTVVTVANQRYQQPQQPQQPGYYQPSYPGQMPPPPSYEQQDATASPPSYGAGAPSTKM